VKTALILGTLPGQVDAIEALRRRGLAVHACGHERVGPGVAAADAFHQVDITDVEAVRRLAEEVSADLVYSVGSDIAMPTVVAVSESLGLPHFHGSALTAVLRDKRALRTRLAEAGLSPVRHRAAAPGEAVPDWDVYPAIVKPVDAQGQRGISVVTDEAGLGPALRTAQAAARSGAAIVEELLEGPEVSAHAYVEGGAVRFFLPSDRHVWDGPMVGVPRAHSVPLSTATASAREAIRGLVGACVQALGVADGPLYFQMILTAEGPRVVEIASRLDGCHLWRLIDLATGFDLLDAVLGRLLGEPWPDAPVEPAAEPMTLEFFLGSPDDVVPADYLARTAKDDALFVDLQVAPGEVPRRVNDVVARLGYEIYRGA
jgi:biotin carboxylase